MAAVLTVHRGKYYQDMLQSDFDDLAKVSLVDYFFDTEENYQWALAHPEILESRMLSTIHSKEQGLSWNDTSVRKFSSYTTMFADEEGKEIFGDEQAFLFFSYMKEADWINSKDNPEAKWESGYLMLSEEEAKRLGSSDAYSLPFTLRLKGRKNGTTFELDSVYYLNSTDRLLQSLLDPMTLLLSEEKIKDNSLGYWKPLFSSDDASAEEAFEVWYTQDAMLHDNRDGKKAILVNGKQYENLSVLLKQFWRRDLPWEERTAEIYDIEENSIFRMLTFSVVPYYKPGGSQDEPEMIQVFGMAAYPLCAAMYSLGWEYGLTFLAGAMLGVLICFMIRRRLLRTLNVIQRGIEEDWRYVYPYDDSDKLWLEAYQLLEAYNKETEERRKMQDELIRIRTALEYAKEGEKNRRRMTSNIAHELKTPLAVIHSYAEGLKEHIAEDKREQYLDVIMAESESMDALVLEMLDLSRLEAGRVRLNRENFSLGELVKNVYGTLEPLAEKKNLQIEIDVNEKHMVTADQDRIRQVITNFVSNALRYTAEEGWIRIKTEWNKGVIRFVVQNQAQAFSEEELEKVWETFYRRDKAREGEGTGLGLAIAKNIVELHGGTCFVRNIEDGVEFGFMLQ